MNKKNAHSRLATVAKQKGLIVQTRRNDKDADDIRILNASTRKVVASGTLKLDASRTGYDSQDVLKIVRQLKTLPSAKKSMNSSRRELSSSRRKKMNSGCHGRKRLNSADDDYVGDDAEFVEDVESVVTDEQGNEIVVDEMLVVQNPETNEISLFVPTEGDEAVPENVEVIGEVTAADSEEVLDSSRKVKKQR